MTAIDELNTALTIDKNTLDEELTYQATLYAEAANGYAMACDVRDAAKKAADEAYARIIVLCKEADPKTTELMLKSKAETHNEYVTAYNGYLKAKLEAAQWEVLVNAYDQRRSMLSRLVDMQVKEFIGSDGASRREVVYNQRVEERRRST